MNDPLMAALLVAIFLKDPITKAASKTFNALFNGNEGKQSQSVVVSSTSSDQSQPPPQAFNCGLDSPTRDKLISSEFHLKHIAKGIDELVRRNRG